MVVADKIVKYRLYVDEVGSASMKSRLLETNERYLSLTGIIVDLDYVQKVMHPQLEALKSKFFNSHPDEPRILHRKELIARKYPFNALMNPQIEYAFNADLLRLILEFDYEVITVAMDKFEHLQRYNTWHFDPYHYAMSVMVERYVLWLERRQAQGDVMAESRGGKEDRRLKDSFTRAYERGSDFVSSERLAGRLTSKQLKVKPKQNNISGLQLADLLAYPAFRLMLYRRTAEPMPENFGKRIAEVLEQHKIVRNPSGKLDGWGIKWLP